MSQIAQATGPERLAAELLAKKVLTSDWLASFQAVPRDRFVPDAIWPGHAGQNRQDDRVLRTETPDLWWDAVYRDAPVTTQWDDGTYTGLKRGRIASSSSSMPTMVFSMLDALDVRSGHRVLEIGTGTGWNAALLSHRVGDENVVTVEVDKALAADARARLNAAGYAPRVVVGDGTIGYGKASPYDRIIATASVQMIPSQWIGQARPGAIIVAPWGPTYGGEGVVRLTIDQTGRAEGRFVGSSAFMRMRQQRRHLPATERFLDPQTWPAEAELSTTRLSPDDVGDWIVMFAIGVQVPDLFLRITNGAEGAYRMWLFDTGVTSWATADYLETRTTFQIAQAGPRKLWDELEAAYSWWETQDKPSFDRFGLTTRGGPGCKVWLDAPDNPVPTPSVQGPSPGGHGS